MLVSLWVRLLVLEWVTPLAAQMAPKLEPQLVQGLAPLLGSVKGQEWVTKLGRLLGSQLEQG
jgi:hypothetical protein